MPPAGWNSLAASKPINKKYVCASEKQLTHRKKYAIVISTDVEIWERNTFQSFSKFHREQTQSPEFHKLVEQLIRKNQVYDPKSEYANVAQSVEQLIRNQQVVCSSHIISSRKQRKSFDFRCFHNF